MLCYASGQTIWVKLVNFITKSQHNSKAVEVASVLAYCSTDPSLNPAKASSYSCKKIREERK